MATGYNDLGINRMDTGSNSGEWGNITNDNWDRITGSISGYKEIDLGSGSSPTHDLDTPDASTPSSADGDGWNKVIKFKGSPSGTPVITIKHGSAKSPRLYFMENATGVAITIKYASTTGVSLAAGLSTVVHGDGADIVKTLADFDGNAATATVATTVTVADESSDTTCFPVFVTGATGNLAPKSGSNLTFNSNTGVLAATSFSGPLTGNVTGNSATATALATARAINGVDFDGTGAITVTAAAGTLSGTELKSTVVTSSLTETGTVATGTWSSDITMGSGDALSVSGGATLKLEGNHPTGTSNLGLGVNSLGSIAAGGSSNIAIGNNAGNALTTEDQNVLMGISAGQHIVHGGGTGVGDNNTFVGHQAGRGGSSTNKSTDNTAIGSCSLESVTTGTHNSFLGKRAGFTLTEGTYNVGNGFESGDDITTGTGNIFIGAQAGMGVQTGDYNVCLGFKSGDSDGANNLGSNKLVIHSDSDGTATPATEALVYGDFSAGTLQVNAPGTGASSSNTFTVKNASGTYTGDVLSVEASDAAGYNLISASANGARVFKVDATGATYNDANTYGTPADYADMFEWADGNPEAEDRIGLSVALDGEGGIRPATVSDDAEDIVGIVSGTACMIGNSAWNHWDGKFLKDEFGRVVSETVDGKASPVLNPEYDETKEYIPRMSRPDWAVVGMTGRVHLRKGSPAHPNWRKIREVSSVTEEWLVR